MNTRAKRDTSTVRLPDIAPRYAEMLARIADRRGYTQKKLLQETIQQVYDRTINRLNAIPSHDPDWAPTASSVYVYCRTCLHVVLAWKAPDMGARH